MKQTFSVSVKSKKGIDIKDLELLFNETTFSGKKLEFDIQDTTGQFQITSVHRDDLKEQGFNPEKVTDGDMEIIARRMANGYVEYDGFWEALRVEAEALKIPKLTTKNKK